MCGVVFLYVIVWRISSRSDEVLACWISEKRIKLKLRTEVVFRDLSNGFGGSR